MNSVVGNNDAVFRIDRAPRTFPAFGKNVGSAIRVPSVVRGGPCRSPSDAEERSLPGSGGVPAENGAAVVAHKPIILAHYPFHPL